MVKLPQKSTVKAEKRSQLSDDASEDDVNEWNKRMMSAISVDVVEWYQQWRQQARDLQRWRVRACGSTTEMGGGVWGAWLSTQITMAAHAGVCALRWLRDFHSWVDWHKTISVVPAKNKSEQCSRQWWEEQWSLQCGTPQRWCQQVWNPRKTTGRRRRFNGERLQLMLWRWKQCWQWSNTNKDKTAKKMLEQWLWYHDKNIEWLYSISHERIYMSAFIYEAHECSTSKSVVQKCVLYK